eukprot:5624948-Amphidinium_carterae.1
MHQTPYKSGARNNEDRRNTTFMIISGRSGEWSLMQVSHVREQLANKAQFLVCPEHKTAASHGDLAK